MPAMYSNFILICLTDCKISQCKYALKYISCMPCTHKVIKNVNYVPGWQPLCQLDQ